MRTNRKYQPGGIGRFHTEVVMETTQNGDATSGKTREQEPRWPFPTFDFVSRPRQGQELNGGQGSCKSAELMGSRRVRWLTVSLRTLNRECNHQPGRPSSSMELPAVSGG